MLIDQLTLKNFQGHKLLTIGLENLTLLVGESSAGKTTVMRGLEWLFYGEWDKTYPNDPSQETAVAARLWNGTIVARFRKGNQQRAGIKEPGKEMVPYSDFGSLIPGIFKLLNVRPIKVGNRTVNLNFSRQDDPNFMVHDSWSKPVRAQWIGRLYGAHIINHMLREMASDKRSAERDRKNKDADMTDLEARLAKYEGLEGRESAIREAEVGLVKLRRLARTKEMMDSVLHETQEMGSKKALLGSDLRGLRASCDRLKRLQDLQIATSLAEGMEGSLAGQKGLLGLDTASLRADVERLDALRRVRRELAEQAEKVAATKNMADSLGKRLAKAQRELKSEMFQGGKCPLCGCKPRRLSSHDMSTNLKAMIGGE